MLNARFSLGAKAGTAHKSKMGKIPIREEITYPKITVTEDKDACLNLALPFKHVLWCGHTVSTSLPREPCAPNYHHVQDDGGELGRSLRNRKAMSMENGNKVSEKKFYCDACVETEMEHKLHVELSASAAEERRAAMRANEAKTRGKITEYRKCYIALKVTSIPCHSDGTISSRYTPREERHRFDQALPRTGDNMFEDVDASPVKEERIVAEMEPDFSTRVRKLRVTTDQRSPSVTAYPLVFSDVESTSDNGRVANMRTASADKREQAKLTRTTTSALHTSPQVTPSCSTARHVTEDTEFLGNRQDYNTAAFQRAQRRNRSGDDTIEDPLRERGTSYLNKENHDGSSEEEGIALRTNKKRKAALVTRQMSRKLKKKKT
jgi:hypothetical protein